MESQVAKIREEWTPEQMKLITDTVAKGATGDELKLFLYRCRKLDLDPLKQGQIHFVKYGTGPGTIVIGVDGFRRRANKTGKLNGINRGVIKDKDGKLTGGWAEVFRKDWEKPVREEVSLSEYNTGRAMWAKIPETMIKKIAEVAALRIAFPDELGELHIEEEMEKQKDSLGAIHPEQPSEEDGVVPDGKYIQFGKFAMRRPDEVDRKELEEYCLGLEQRIKMGDKRVHKDEKTLKEAKETVELIASFLSASEADIEEEAKK